MLGSSRNEVRLEQWVKGTSLNTRRNQLYFLLQRENLLKAAIDADGSDKQ